MNLYYNIYGLKSLCSCHVVFCSLHVVGCIVTYSGAHIYEVQLHACVPLLLVHHS